MAIKTAYSRWSIMPKIVICDQVGNNVHYRLESGKILPGEGFGVSLPSSDNRVSSPLQSCEKIVESLEIYC
jgi:hypothetical protein